MKKLVRPSGWLSIAEVTKRFDGTVALGGVSLEIDRGEFFCLLGPSGCGKTTLLRIVAGFEAPDTGEICLRGRQLRNVPPDRRSLGMVFQHYALFPHLSVFDNVAFSLRAGKWLGRRQRPANLRAAVDGALELVGLEGLADRFPKQLSGGQAQRVALARALVRRPDVLLLDEPLSALDLKVRHAMRDELRALQHELGTTFVFVTHDQDEALSMATRIALMNRGLVEQVATPEQLYREPLTRFGAHFVGQQTFIRAHCKDRDGDRLVVTWLGQTFSTVDRSNATAGSVVDVMIRPEEIEPTEPTAEEALGVVEAVTFRGGDLEISVTTPAEKVKISCPARSGAELGPGNVIGLRVHAHAGVAFDSVAGMQAPVEEQVA